MPCYDTDDHPDSEYSKRAKRNHQTMTRLSCDRCRELEARGGTVPEWAQEWWREHKKRDAYMQAQDPQTRHAAKIRQQAILKLTLEERNELGV